MTGFTYWVAILASKHYGTLTIGVTNDLLGRVDAYREKTLKRYVRQWKINLIECENPHWADHYPALLAFPGNRTPRLAGGWVLETSPRMTTERLVGITSSRAMCGRSKCPLQPALGADRLAPVVRHRR